jgi:ribonuclease-3 family protein
VKSREEEQFEPIDAQPKLNLSDCQILSTITQKLSPDISVSQIQQISPSALAYLGDAVYELYVRMSYLLPPQRPENYHRLVVAQVRAETQAQIMRSLTPYLSTHELEIARRGRNAVTNRPKRVKLVIYQQATSLETLIGYLYLTDTQRLTELLQKLQLQA